VVQAIYDPQKLAGKNNHFGCVLWVCRDVPVTLWILIKANRTGEEICHRFLFGGWELRISKRSGRCRLTLLLGGPERIAHQFLAKVIGAEFASVADGDFHLPESLEDGGIIFAAHESRIYLAGDERVKLALWQEASFTIGRKIFAGRDLPSPP
jgi:hypothetical protein